MGRGKGDKKRKQEKGRGRWVSSLASREERERKRKNEREKGMSELQGWHIPRPDITEAGGKRTKEDGGNSCLNQLIFMFSIHILPIKSLRRSEKEKKGRWGHVKQILGVGSCFFLQKSARAPFLNPPLLPPLFMTSERQLPKSTREKPTKIPLT